MRAAESIPGAHPFAIDLDRPGGGTEFIRLAAEAMGGIVGLSDILIVSGESISMISEAASSGKNTIVFPLQKRKEEGGLD